MNGAAFASIMIAMLFIGSPLWILAFHQASQIKKVVEQNNNEAEVDVFWANEMQIEKKIRHEELLDQANDEPDIDAFRKVPVNIIPALFSPREQAKKEAEDLVNEASTAQ